MQGQGYDDTTLASRRDYNNPNGFNNMGGNPRGVQGINNPLIDEQGRCSSKLLGPVFTLLNPFPNNKF